MTLIYLNEELREAGVASPLKVKESMSEIKVALAFHKEVTVTSEGYRDLYTKYYLRPHQIILMRE
jgi:hypothetical protein